MGNAQTTTNHHYHSQAASVKFKDITSSAVNRAILHRIKNNDPSLIRLCIDATDEDHDANVAALFQPRESDDLGWLGFFIGENMTLKSLYIYYLPMCKDQIGRLFNGLEHNKSIKEVEFSPVVGSPVESFSSIILPHVTTMRVGYNLLDREKVRCIAVGLQRCKSLVNYSGPIAEEIVTSLLTLPMLEKVNVWVEDDIPISRDECLALRRFLGESTSVRYLHICNAGLGNDGLELLVEGLACNTSLIDGVLDLSRNAIDDQGFQALASCLASNDNLRTLHLRLTNNNIGDAGLEALAPLPLRQLSLSGNISITEIGVTAISRALSTPNTSLEHLCLGGINIGDMGLSVLAEVLGQNKTLKSLVVGHVDDEGACALAAAIGVNTSLTSLKFDGERITSIGWNALLKSLCDTSSPHNTHLSNHTLRDLSLPNVDTSAIQERIRTSIIRYLRVNKDYHEQHLAAKHKILTSFPHINITPLLEWRLKTLPFVKNWFDTVTSSNESFAASIESRKLSAVYQFVKGEPLLVVERAACAAELELDSYVWALVKLGAFTLAAVIVGIIWIAK